MYIGVYLQNLCMQIVLISSINLFQPRLGPKPFTPPKFDSDTAESRNTVLDNDVSSNIMTTSLPDYINSNNTNPHTNGNDKTSPEPQTDHENNDEVSKISIPVIYKHIV